MPLQSNTCNTNLLDDLPAEDDHFQAHSRIASAIKNSILDSRDGNGKSIALLGELGSGKSTVINLLETKLDNTGSEVFIYDAWAHKDDTLKRSFLEDLLDFLKDQEREWISPDNDEWKRKEKQLKGSSKEIEKKTVPLIGKFGFALITTLFGSAIALNFLGFMIDGPNLISVFLLTLLLILPLLTVLGGLIYANFSSELVSTSDSEKNNFNQFLAPFISETSSQENITSYISPQPTTIEFREFFSDLLHTVMIHEGESIEDRSLIIVFDNIDRIVGTKLKEVFSTVNTFLNKNLGGEEDDFDNLWTITPYSEESLSTMDRQQKEKIGDKVFDVKFDVPKPISSDWKEYFRSLFKKCFPEHEDQRRLFEDIYMIYRTGELKSVNSQRSEEIYVDPPTPRDLKLFLNQLVAIHRQWGDEWGEESDKNFPLKIQAFYLVNKDDISSDPTMALRQDELEKNNIHLIKYDQCQKYLAALNFGKKPDEAKQILLNQQLRNYFILGSNDERSPEDLRDIKQGNPYFEEGLKNYVSHNYNFWSDNTPEVIPEVILEINDIGGLENELYKDDVYPNLAKGLTEISDWGFLNSRASTGVVQILEYFEKERQIELLSKIIPEISSTITNKLLRSEMRSEAKKKFQEGVKNLVRYIAHEDLFSARFKPDYDNLQDVVNKSISDLTR